MSEEEKAELDNKKRLTQQSLLMMNLYNLSALNRDLYTKGQGKYKNFVCLEDDNPEIFMSKLMGVNMLGPSRMKSHHFSSLVPEMRFFKVINGDSKEIVFPTHAGTAQHDRYAADLNTSFSSLASAPPNMGVKNIDWAFQGTTAFAEKTTLIVNVQLYAERISDLFSTVIGQNDKDLKYSDLFTLSSKYKIDKDKNSKKKENNPDHFRIKMQVGWSITDELARVFENEENSSSVKRAINLLREQKTLMDLDLTNFDFDFGQEGAVTVNLTYKSHLESMFTNPYHSNILFSEKEAEKTAKIKIEMKKLQDKVKKEQDSMSETEKDDSNEKVEKLQKDLAEEQADAAKTYASIVTELLRSRRIRIYTVSKENILYRYQYQNVEQDLEHFETSCDQGISPQVFDGYTYVSSIPVSKMVENEMSSEDPHLKIYIKTGSDGTEKVYTYHDYNTADPSIGLYPGHANNGLIPQRDLKRFVLTSLWGEEVFQERYFNDLGNEIESEISKNPIEKPQCAVKKMSTDEVNENANKLADIETSEDKEKKVENMREMFDELSKPEFKDGEYNIKYFCLGDLIEVALEKLKKKNPKMWNEFRVVVGSAEFTTYSNSDQLFGFYDVSLKNGVVSINRTKLADERIRQKTATSSEKYVEISRKMNRYYRNLADIPIALSTFLNWYDENYISKNIVNMPFTKFLKGVMQLAIKSLSIVDDEFALLPKQNVMVARTMISVPKETDGIDYFKFNNSSGDPSDDRFTFEEIRNLATPKLEKDKMKQVSKGTGLSLKESKLKGHNFTGQTTDYLILHSGAKSIPPERRLNFMDDSKDGIPHFFVGGESGLMKSINFSLKENQLMKSDAMLRSKTAFNTPRFPISGKYDVELTLFGNTFFNVGSVIVINPSALRLGNMMDPQSQINALGISGYYVVTKVSSYIQGGTYETKISATRQSPGNGFNLAGKHMTKLPSREALDKKKRDKEKSK